MAPLASPPPQLRLADEPAARAFHPREDERLARLETHDEHAPAPVQ
jgi:hypothetical protein